MTAERDRALACRECGAATESDHGPGCMNRGQRPARKRLWRLEVVWSDSQLLGGSWDAVESVLKRRKAVRCRSVGFVLADDERGIVLAASVNGSNAAGVTIIPAGQILSRRRLR